MASIPFLKAGQARDYMAKVKMIAPVIVFVSLFMLLGGHVVYAQSPEFGDHRWVTAFDHARVSAEWPGNPVDCNRGHNSREEIYVPEPGYAILEHRVIEHSRSNGSAGVSTLAADMDIATYEMADREYQSAINAAYRDGAESYAADLEIQRRNHLEVIRRYTSSHTALRLRLEATASGNCADKKRGWIEVSVRALVMYVGDSNPNAMASNIRQSSQVVDFQIDRWGAYCIINRTGRVLNYRYRWGQGDWQTTPIDPDQSWIHSWTYEGSFSSPDAQIQFDADLTNGTEWVTYDLSRYRISEKTCQQAYRYEFVTSGNNRVDLKSISG